MGLGNRVLGCGEWPGDAGILGDGPPQASSWSPRPGALPARAAASGLRGPAGARRSSSADPEALRPTSCPRSHLAAARSLSKWPPGPAALPAEALAQAQGTRLVLRVSFRPRASGSCVEAVLGGPSPAGFAAGPR